jgi:lysophospholipid acyltransferase (LPLAT)-like uncharacterized protein
MKAPSRWGRRVLRSSRLRLLLCWAIHLYIRFVYATNRWRVQGGEVPRRLREGGNSFVLAFWHGRLMMIPMAWQRLAPMHMLISAHRDGGLSPTRSPISGVTRLRVIKARWNARRTMLRLSAGIVGITPDGPRGPAMRASTDHNVARRRVPIVPIVCHQPPPRAPGTGSISPAVRPRRLSWASRSRSGSDLDQAGSSRPAPCRKPDERDGKRPTVASGTTPVQEVPLPFRLAGEGHSPERAARPLAVSGAAGALGGSLPTRGASARQDGAPRERFGIAPPPAVGAAGWVHAASVGEASSVPALIERILAERLGSRC